jgi:hypothetical protein
MKINHPLRKFGRAVVGAMPAPLAEQIRGVKRAVLNRRSATAVFRGIYVDNEWDGAESVSGPGSSLAATANIRAALPGLIRDLGVKTLLDVPCGDAYWISTCLPPGVSYIGGDIVPELIERNTKDHGAFGTFRTIDIIKDPLPAADLILLRDCFIHLSNAMVVEALANIRRASITYLLTTTYTGIAANIDIELGGFRPVDLTLAPMRLPAPQRLNGESEGQGKCIGLWRVADL